jgi:hypothetical protein
VASGRGAPVRVSVEGYDGQRVEVAIAPLPPRRMIG